jgi:hypothetical protein
VPAFVKTAVLNKHYKRGPDVAKQLQSIVWGVMLGDKNATEFYDLARSHFGALIKAAMEAGFVKPTDPVAKIAAPDVTLGG